MALRAFYEQVNKYGVLDRVEIHQDDFSGDVIRLNSRGTEERFRFEHQEITREGAGGILNVHDNIIMMGVFSLFPYIDSQAKKDLIKDISDSGLFEFKLVWKKDATVLWEGYPSGRVTNFPERNVYFAEIQFKDFEVLQKVNYPFTDKRQHLIKTIAELLNFGYDSQITTVTSWQESNTNGNDDFLNQIYSDTVGLRNYGSTGDIDDTQIPVYQALLRLAEPCLLIKQWKGFRIDQVSGYSDSTAVLQCVYDSSGDQLSSDTVDVTYSGSKQAFTEPNVIVTSDNETYPSVRAAEVFFNFRTSESGIQVPSNITLEESTAETGTITASTGSTGVGGSGTSFLDDVDEGDEIWATQSGELALLGTVATVVSNTSLILTSTANFTYSGAWHLNARETAVFTQDFISSGNQKLWFSSRVRITGTFGTLVFAGRYSLRVGDVYYNAQAKIWNTVEVINDIQTSGANINRTGVVSLETTNIPSGKEGIELKFYIATDNFGSSQFVDVTTYEDTDFKIRDNVASGNSNGIRTRMNQLSGVDVYSFGTDFYGDGVGGVLYLPSNYRHGTNTIQVTDRWRRRGETEYQGFHRLKLREVLDFQRTRIRKIYADVWGEIDPTGVMVYDSTNFLYVGGSYDGAWHPRYMEINEQTGDDQIEENLADVDVGGGINIGSGAVFADDIQRGRSFNASQRITITSSNISGTVSSIPIIPVGENFISMGETFYLFNLNGASLTEFTLNAPQLPGATSPSVQPKTLTETIVTGSWVVYTGDQIANYVTRSDNGIRIGVRGWSQGILDGEAWVSGTTDDSVKSEEDSEGFTVDFEDYENLESGFELVDAGDHEGRQQYSESEIAVLKGQIILKTTTDGRLALVRLDSRPETGSIVEIAADNINLNGLITAINNDTSDFTQIDGGKIRATSSVIVGTGNNIAALSGEGTTRIYAGNADPSAAPFRVLQNGNVIATRFVQLDGEDVDGVITNFSVQNLKVTGKIFTENDETVFDENGISFIIPATFTPSASLLWKTGTSEAHIASYGTGASVLLEYKSKGHNFKDDDGEVLLNLTSSAFTINKVNVVNINLSALPTTDPSIAGRLWQDSGDLRISLG